MNKPLAFFAVLSLLCPLAAHAADDGQLWETTSHMDLSNMPEAKAHGVRMNDFTNQVCRSSDMKEAVTKSKDMKDCQVLDMKQDGGNLSLSLKCKEGRTAEIKMVFDKARSSYTGKAHMTDPKHGAMDMTMSGKKIGTCDLAAAQQERAERRAQIDRIKAQAAATQAQTNEYTKRVEGEQIAKCSEAVETMNSEGLGYWGMCHSKKDANCKMMLETFGSGQNAKIGEACAKKADEFCRRFQTVDGFLAATKAEKVSGAEQVCGVQAEDLKPKLCKSAVKSDSYEFIGYNCPKDAAPLAKAHCAGRSYTSSDPRAKKDKWYAFCVAVAGRYMEGDSQAASSSSSGESSSDESADAKGVAKKAAKKAAVNALKGLFGH